MKKHLFHSENTVDVQRIISVDTPFAIKEAYRALYTNILYLPIEDKCKKIVVTSAIPGEGKTSISINLAYTTAMNSPESRVLLVDADMRCPRISDLLGKDIKAHGLSEFLAGIDKEPSVQSTIYPNLSFFASGSGNANTPGLISSSRMKLFIDYCNENFDYVFFDTPPVNVVADTALLRDSVNGFLLVARADFSDTNSLSDAVKKLQASDANIFGIVLCCYQPKGGRGFGRYGKQGKYVKNGKYEKYGNFGKDGGTDK